MQIKLTIPGEYWDSQINSGRLYLFGLSGDIITLDWNRLLQELKIDSDLRLAFKACFQGSNLFYRTDYRRRFQDQEERDNALNNFFRLSQLHLSLSRKQINSLLIGQQDNQFPFPHSDSLIYRGRLYVSSQSGVYRGACQQNNKFPISSRPARRFTGPVLSMSASKGKLALGAG